MGDLVFPAAHLVNPGGWIYARSPNGLHGTTDNMHRRMAVPVGNDETATIIRTHELAHARWSPNEPGDIAHAVNVSAMSLLAAEDGRIGYLTRQAGREAVPLKAITKLARNEHAKWEFPESGIDRGRFALTIAGDMASSVGVALHDRFSLTELRIVEQAQGLIYPGAALSTRSATSDKPTFDDTIEAARLIDSLIMVPVGEQSGPENVIEKLINGPAPGSGRDNTWGEMEEQRAPTLGPRRRPAAERRATDRGAALAYPSRYLSDRQVFARRARPDDGAVLIDVSGSMDLDAAEVDALVKAIPYGQIAVYSGVGGDDTGFLRVIADRSQVAPVGEYYPHDKGLGNVVDGPALDWLARQPGRRIWISDGDVTGTGGDRMSDNLTNDAFGKVRRGAITRYGSPAEYLEREARR